MHGEHEQRHRQPHHLRSHAGGQRRTEGAPPAHRPSRRVTVIACTPTAAANPAMSLSGRAAVIQKSGEARRAGAQPTTPRIARTGVQAPEERRHRQHRDRGADGAEQAERVRFRSGDALTAFASTMNTG